MLVLSRSEGDGIAFPELELALKVLKVQGTKVQIGISAAEEIRVLRSELLSRVEHQIEGSDREARHELRNRLNAASLALTIAQKHLERGDLQKAELALSKMAQTAGLNSSAASTRLDSTAVPPIPSNQSVRVLLIEDNPNEASLLAEILGLNGFSVEMVRNGLEAIDALQVRIPDIVLMDMNMPECDGPTTVERIRKDDRLRNLPIYAVSGASQAEIGVKTCNDQGVNDWFQKPVQSRDLLERLKCTPIASMAC